MGNVDGSVVGATLGGPREGTDRTGQRCTTYELTEQLLRHLYGDGNRGEVRLQVSLDEAAWARYRSEVQRPFGVRPSVVVVPVPGVGAMEFRRMGREAEVCGARPAPDAGEAWRCPLPPGHYPATEHADYTGKPWPEANP